MKRPALGLSIDAVYDRMVREAKRTHEYAARPRGQSVAAWQKRLRRKLLQLLALDDRPRPAPGVRFVEETRGEGCVRQRGYLVASDGLALPFYLLRPAAPATARLGVCLAIHGHSPGKETVAGVAAGEPARQALRDGEKDYGAQAAREGYLTVIPDLRGMGELILREDLRENRGSCSQLANRALEVGRPLLGQRVSDMRQLLDWALARRDADPRRVILVGCSGGGTVTLFTAAVDARIRAAAPVAYFSSFAGSILAMSHCACNYVPGLLEAAEMSDLAGLIAPRLLLIVAGAADPIFPIDAVRTGYAELARIYADAGAARNLELHEASGGHRFYAQPVWDFFRRRMG